MKEPVRIAVLVSGGGSNLQALLHRFNTRTSAVARVQLVISSRPDAGALERAARAEVPSLVLDPRSEASVHATAMLDALEQAGIGLIVLAGYLHLVPAAVVERYRGRMLNVHPALLPAFGGAGMYGRRVHEAVLAAGVRLSGATVHQVDERYDEGAIVAQWPVPVLSGDTVATLASRVLQVEHLLLPAAVEALASGKASSTPAQRAAFALADAPWLADVLDLNR